MNSLVLSHPGGGPRLLNRTAVPRVGLRGKNAARYLQEHGFAIPLAPNRAIETDAGELVLRLGATEFWVLAAPSAGAEALGELEHGVCPEFCYRLFCRDSHGWLTVTGEQATAGIMAKLCAIDLRDGVFEDLRIAQTSVARINVIVIKHRLDDVPALSLLFDSGYQAYLSEVLLDATGEFGGDSSP